MYAIQFFKPCPRTTSPQVLTRRFSLPESLQQNHSSWTPLKLQYSARGNFPKLKGGDNEATQLPNLYSVLHCTGSPAVLAPCSRTVLLPWLQSGSNRRRNCR